MFSCTKEEVKVEKGSQPLKYIFNIADKPSFDADTKSVKTAWEDGDKLYIVFDDALPESFDDFMIMEYDAAAEDWVVSQESANAPSAEGGVLDALYYGNPDPAGMFVDNEDGGEFLFESEGSKYGKYMFLTAKDVAYTVEDGNVMSSISMDFIPNSVRTYVQFCITGIEGDWEMFNIDIDNSEKNDLVNCIPIWQMLNKGFQDKSDLSMIHQMDSREDGQYLYFSIFQSAESITVTLNKKSGENVGLYHKTFSKKISGKSAAVTFKGPQFNSDGVPVNGWTRVGSISSDGHGYVDMGDGLLWATENVGARDPRDRGDYFAWGEVEPHYTSYSPLVWKEGYEDGYSASTYKYWEYADDEHTYGRYTKYTAGEGGEILESTDDAASANWGGEWRTPTYPEWKALSDNSTILSLGNQLYLLRSTVPGYEDMFIILSGQGYFNGTNFRDTLYYMSSTTSSSLGRAIAPSISDTMGFYSLPRTYGIQVRPVMTKE